MNKSETINELQPMHGLDPQREAVTKFEPQHHQVSASMSQQPLTGVEMKLRLNQIHDVMRTAMTEGQDYGKIPGCGDKPGLFQPGAQKLSMMFQLNPEVRNETINDYPGYHRGFRFVVRVMNGSKFADGVGECSTLESKYRYRAGARKCPKCGGEFIIKGQEQYGGGWLCFGKKGGCGAKWPDGAKEIEEQSTSKVEHENPPDYWNTVRKMAFKRAFVHAIINATNTSELWSQDLEDLAGNGVVSGENAPKQEQKTERVIQGAKPRQQTPGRQENTVKPVPNAQERAGIKKESNLILEEYNTVSSKPGVEKPWVIHKGKFATDSGSLVECMTFDAHIGKLMAELQGQEVTISHKPGRQANTLELVSIEVAEESPLN